MRGVCDIDRFSFLTYSAYHAPFRIPRKRILSASHFLRFQRVGPRIFNEEGICDLGTHRFDTAVLFKLSFKFGLACFEFYTKNLKFSSNFVSYRATKRVLNGSDSILSSSCGFHSSRFSSVFFIPFSSLSFLFRFSFSSRVSTRT